ncbi:SRPBCC domain-containing protein [Corallococcus sp. ZKHCc1 1396]|uniref:SRPBCC domain-containing protein n=1 Tax=Corallococcus soli TaxID=2710757 RepID=A0ABR9PTZ0_9BACT|nr:SRPBCC domain-containing protein [Corallococcus soli]MBE4751397.1 SRPBCC domain-containing protein [Corallococcus soli]
MPRPHSLTLQRQLSTTAAEAFDFWVNPTKVAVWWGPNAGDTSDVRTFEVRVGGKYRVLTHAPNGDTYDFTGEFRAVEPGRKVSFTWDVEKSGPSQVTVTLDEQSGGAQLTLVHEGLQSEQDRDACIDGWNGALDKLEREARQWASGQGEAPASL